MRSRLYVTGRTPLPYELNRNRDRRERGAAVLPRDAPPLRAGAPSDRLPLEFAARPEYQRQPRAEQQPRSRLGLVVSISYNGGKVLPLRL